MSTERWQQLDRVFIEAIQRPADERGAFIEEACRADPALEAEALALLAAADESSDFMSTSALEYLAKTGAAAAWTLRPGDRVGAFTVLDRLGAGAVGEVWRARDERLGRDVAIKIVAPYAASDSERRRRFAEEARLAGSLNHPNLLTVHDVGEHGGLPILVTECLDGQSLRQRLEAGPLPVDKAIHVALGITRGLAAAHARGIVHRDVKPENVFLQTDGNVKILDFGLAKLLPSISSEPVARYQTLDGLILGTAGYMAPEQVRGEPVDARADLFAVGVMAYEMLAGRNPFKRATIVEAMHATLTADVLDLTVEGRTVPPAVGKLVMRLLEKSPQARFQSAQDLAWALEQLADGPASDHPEPVRAVDPYVSPAVETALAAAEPPRARRRRLSGYAAAALLGVAFAALAWFAPGRDERPSEPTIRSVIALPDKVTAAVGRGSIAFAPDGSSIVYKSRVEPGQLRRYRLADGVDTVIDGTAGAVGPFFSPDGHWLGFFAGGFLKKVSINGGTPTNLCPAQSSWGGSWGPDGFIVFSHLPETGLFRVSDSGGTPELITRLAPEDAGNDHRFPELLPGGRAILYSVATGPEDTARIVVADVRTGERKELIQGAASARFVAPNHVAYARNGDLFASPFSLERLEITGPPRRIASDVAEGADGCPEFTFSRSGDLVYLRGVGAPANRLMLVDMNGIETLLEGPPQYMLLPRVSPDGGTVAYFVGAAKNNVWLYDLEKGTTTRRTFGRFHEPVWRPDGRLTVAEGGPGSQQIVLLSKDGSGRNEVLVENGPALPESWSPDGGTLVYRTIQPQGQWNLWTLTMASRQQRALAPSPFDQTNARFSPDGRWLAYVSNETGRNELYVRSVEDGGRSLISNAGAQMAAWAPDGRRLYYRDLLDGMWAADIAGAPQFQATRARLVFRVPDPSSSFDITADGTGFVAIKLERQRWPMQLDLVLNPLSATRDGGRPGPTRP